MEQIVGPSCFRSGTNGAAVYALSLTSDQELMQKIMRSSLLLSSKVNHETLPAIEQYSKSRDPPSY